MKHSTIATSTPSLVPKGITIGLGIFAVFLGLAGFVFRWAMGEDFFMLIPNILFTIAIFWVAIPVGFVIGAKILNRFSHKPPIHSHNALTLGLLFSCVSMLWMMSVYS